MDKNQTKHLNKLFNEYNKLFITGISENEEFIFSGSYDDYSDYSDYGDYSDYNDYA